MNGLTDVPASVKSLCSYFLFRRRTISCNDPSQNDLVTCKVCSPSAVSRSRHDERDLRLFPCPVRQWPHWRPGQMLSPAAMPSANQPRSTIASGCWPSRPQEHTHKPNSYEIDAFHVITPNSGQEGWLQHPQNRSGLVVAVLRLQQGFDRASPMSHRGIAPPFDPHAKT